MNEEKKLTPTLSEDEVKYYDDKCIELAEKYKQPKVYACVMIDSSTLERIPAYFHEPDFMTKLALIDDAYRDGTRIAANKLRELCLLRDDSHPKMVVEHPSNHKYQLGAAEYCIGIIEIARDQLKKN